MITVLQDPCAQTLFHLITLHSSLQQCNSISLIKKKHKLHLLLLYTQLHMSINFLVLFILPFFNLPCLYKLFV